MASRSRVLLIYIAKSFNNSSSFWCFSLLTVSGSHLYICGWLISLSLSQLLSTQLLFHLPMLAHHYPHQAITDFHFSSHQIYFSHIRCHSIHFLIHKTILSIYFITPIHFSISNLIALIYLILPFNHLLFFPWFFYWISFFSIQHLRLGSFQITYIYVGDLFTMSKEAIVWSQQSHSNSFAVVTPIKLNL